LLPGWKISLIKEVKKKKKNCGRKRSPGKRKKLAEANHGD
jgi:hypothetical protein